MPTTTDNLLAKGMHAAKDIKATVGGLVGVFRTLAEQHGEVAALLKRVQRDPDRRDELWPNIRRELLSHEHGEARVVYSELRKYDSTRDFAEEHALEAGQLELAIEKVDNAGDEFPRVFDDLVKLVESHVALEENTIFPKAMDEIGEDGARELDTQFLAAKQSDVA